MDLDALGERIRSARHERGLTLQDAAALAGVSVSMLSSVERGDKAPTIVVLDKIASGLGLRTADLLTEPPGRLVVRRAGDQDVVEEAGGWTRTILTPVVPGVNVELVRTTLPPGCDAGEFPAYAPGSHEFVVVETGRLTLEVDDTRAILHIGDSAYFAADAPHRYANDGTIPCTYLVAAFIMRPRTPGTRFLHAR